MISAKTIMSSSLISDVKAHTCETHIPLPLSERGHCNESLNSGLGNPWKSKGRKILLLLALAINSNCCKKKNIASPFPATEKSKCWTFFITKFQPHRRNFQVKFHILFSV